MSPCLCCMYARHKQLTSALHNCRSLGSSWEQALCCIAGANKYHKEEPVLDVPVGALGVCRKMRQPDQARTPCS